MVQLFCCSHRVEVVMPTYLVESTNMVEPYITNLWATSSRDARVLYCTALCTATQQHTTYR